MNGLFVIAILMLGLQITIAEVNTKIYTLKDINEACTWTFSQIYESTYFLSPKCSEYWDCDYEYIFFHRVLHLVVCTGKAKYFDPYANGRKGVTL